MTSSSEAEAKVRLGTHPVSDPLHPFRSNAANPGVWAPVTSSSAEHSEVSEGTVYALGTVAHDFPNRSRRAAFKQRMDGGGSPEDPASLLLHLEANPYDAEMVQWTLNVEGVPIYILEPSGPYAAEAYGRLRLFLHEQLTEGVERVSIPGQIVGLGRHRSGLQLPLVVPVIGGMYSWTTQVLVASVIAAARLESADDAGLAPIAELESAVTGFLERVYFELRNAGRSPHDRAINFAATNAFEVERIFERVIGAAMEVDTIEVEPAAISVPGSDCWDVKLVFFSPELSAQSVRRLYRFTVDVADVIPVTVGPMRTWSLR